MMASTRSLLAAAAVLAMLAPGAHAATASASAEIHDLKYQLIDLNPNDGILPTITFDYSSANQESKSWSPWASHVGGADSSTQVVHASGSASTASSATGLAAAVALSSDYYRSYEASARNYYDFILSPYTAVLITAVGSLDVDAGGSTASAATIEFDASLDHLDAGGVRGGTYYSQRYDSRDGAGDYSFAAYFASGATSEDGFIILHAGSSTWLNAPTAPVDPTSPVPEPETYGMLVAGLAVVGALSRRRRSAT